MSSMYIKRIWSDINMIELEISANGLGIDIYSQSDFYVTEIELLELKEKLIRFPINKEDSVE